MAILVDEYSPASGTHVFTARNASGQWWNGTAFEAYNAANIATYAITATSKSLGWYQGSLNDLAVSYDLRIRAGASLATTDPVIAAGQVAVKSDTLRWNSTAVTGMPMPTYTQPTGFLAATFPSTVSSYAGADTTGTTTLLSRVPGSLTISGGKVAATVASGDDADAASIKTTIGTAGAGLTALAPAATALSTATWTSTRAGYIDLLSNATYGLSVLARRADLPTNFSTLSLTASQTVGTSTLTAANVWAYTIGGTAAGTLLGDTFGTVDQIPIGGNGAILADVQYIAGQTANAAAAVTFPASIGTSTYAGGAVASVTGNVGGNVVGSVGSIPNVTLAATQSLYAPAKAGDAMTLTSAYDAAKTAASATTAAAIKAKTDNLPASPASTTDVQPTINFNPTINPTTLDSTERTAIAAQTLSAINADSTQATARTNAATAATKATEANAKLGAYSGTGSSTVKNAIEAVETGGGGASNRTNGFKVVSIK